MKKNLEKLLKKNRSGASLIMVMVLVAIVIVFAFGVSEIVVVSTRQGAAVENADQAYYAAEGAAEEALFEIKEQGIGYGTPNQKAGPDYSTNSGTTQQSGSNPQQPSTTKSKTVSSGATSKYKITGLLPDNSYIDGYYKPYKGAKFYSFPAAGTGEAGGRDCADLGPILSVKDLLEDDKMIKPSSANQQQSSPYTKADLIFDDPANHSCNWGVLRPRDTIDIPLFVEKGNGIVLNPGSEMNESPNALTAKRGGLGITEIYMSFRPPCKVQSFVDPKTKKSAKKRPLNCLNKDREVIDEKEFPLALDWSINGGQWQNGKGVVGTVRGTPAKSIYGNMRNNGSIISSLNINRSILGNKIFVIDQYRDIVLNKVRIDGFLDLRSGTKIHKPLLSLESNKPLKNTNKELIPYMEYQIITDARIPGLKPIVEVEGLKNGVQQNIKIQSGKKKGIIDFVVD